MSDLITSNVNDSNEYGVEVMPIFQQDDQIFYPFYRVLSLVKYILDLVRVEVEKNFYDSLTKLEFLDKNIIRLFLEIKPESIPIHKRVEVNGELIFSDSISEEILKTLEELKTLSNLVFNYICAIESLIGNLEVLPPQYFVSEDFKVFREVLEVLKEEFKDDNGGGLSNYQIVFLMQSIDETYVAKNQQISFADEVEYYKKSSVIINLIVSKYKYDARGRFNILVTKIRKILENLNGFYTVNISRLLPVDSHLEKEITQVGSLLDNVQNFVKDRGGKKLLGEQNES